MSKHTPGPWIHGNKNEMYLDGNRLIWSSKGEGYGTIAEASSYFPNSMDNARLISAAPDLLDACRKAMTCANLPDSVKDIIRVAIARATRK